MLNSLTDVAKASGDDVVCDDVVCHLGESVISEYLLVCEARCTSLTDGYWSFSLEMSDGSPVFSASDNELGDLNRLTLLGAVRGLESIEGASSVTLLSNNRYLIRSLADSLPRWRENNFVWEHFGRRIDVQHADLWRRIDGALRIHRVEACMVSSRLVSPLAPTRGRDASESFAPASSHSKDRVLRIDGPDVSFRGPHRRSESGSPSKAAEQSRKQPPDRLRRWLLGGGASAGSAPVRRRISAADLLEIS